MTRSGLTPKQLQEFLEIKSQRLRLWLDQGLFGQGLRGIGQGRTRKYSLEDVVLAWVLRDLLDLTRSRTLRIMKPEELREIVAECLAGGPGIGIIVDGKRLPREFLVLAYHRKGKDYQYAFLPVESTPIRRGSLPQIVIPIMTIIRETKAFFEKAGLA